MRGSVYRRRDRDSVRWCAHVKWTDVGGKKRQRKKTCRTEREAERALTEMLSAIDTGGAVASDPSTVDGFAAGWVEHLRAVVGLKPSTVASYGQTIRRYVSPAIGSTRLQHVTAADINGIYAAMSRRGLSARTIRYLHSVLRKMFSDAERQGLVPVNVVARATPPTTVAARSPRFPTWTIDELDRFLCDIDGRAQGGPITFAALTGARRGEVVALRWADIDQGARTASISRSVTVVEGALVVGPTKTHSARSVALDHDLVEMLRRHRLAQTEWRLQVGAHWVDSGLVFPGPAGDYLDPETLSQQFNRLVASSGLPRIRFHDLRHTHATLLIEAGYDAKTVSERLGHSTVAFTLDRYVHPSAGQQLEAVDALAQKRRATRGLPKRLPAGYP